MRHMTRVGLLSEEKLTHSCLRVQMRNERKKLVAVQIGLLLGVWKEEEEENKNKSWRHLVAK